MFWLFNKVVGNTYYAREDSFYKKSHMIDLNIKLVHPNAKIPARASEFAGGWDVYAAEIIQEAPDFVIVDLGFQLEIPVGYKLTLVPRSSLTKTYWIQQNSPGLGDCDYRGNYQYRFRAIPIHVHEHKCDDYGIEINNQSTIGSVLDQKPIYIPKLSYSTFPYQVGDRIGQIYLESVIPIQFKQIEVLSDTERGDGGFGSTGR